MPGRHLAVRFDRMGPDGEALAAFEGRTLAVPYAAPGEEATVRLVDVAPGRLHGRIVALRSTSACVVRPRCPHFGRCGGCQWQHLDYPTQLEQKTLLVRDALARAGLGGLRVDPAIGWDPPWEFRTRFEAAVGTRDGRPVLGFFTWGGERVVDVRTCPVQHPGSVAVLSAVRAGWAALAPDVLAHARIGSRRRPGPADGGGPLRGVIARVAAATGEVMLALAVCEPLSLAGRAAAVHALIDRVPGLVSIMEVRVLRRGHLRRGRPASLLWGRGYIREEVAGVRYHVPVLAEFPANARAFPGVIEMVLAELDAGPGDTIVEPDAGIGAYTLHLALSAGRVVALTDDRLLDAAWANARLNRIQNCLFYTRDPIRALEKAARRGPVRLALLHPPGAGLPAGLPDALRRVGVARAVYLGRSVGALCRDAAALGRAGYEITRVQPLDTSPQTSRLTVLVTAAAGSAR